MPQGIQIFDAAGNLVVDVTDRLTQVMGMFSTGQVSGSFVVPATGAGNAVWAQFLPDGAGAGTSAFSALPEFYLEGSTISWAFPASTSLFKQGGTVIYGRF